MTNFNRESETMNMGEEISMNFDETVMDSQEASKSDTVKQYLDKQKNVLGRQKFAGQSGRGRLVSENEIEELDEVRKAFAELPKKQERKLDHEQIWQQVKSDRQMRGILAFLARADFYKREELFADDIKTVLYFYPTKKLFQDQVKFLHQLLRVQNSDDKYQQYLQKTNELEKILYPN